MSQRELLQWQIVTVLLLTAQIALRNRKMFEKYLELAKIFFHSLSTTQMSIELWECQNESDVCDADCSLSPRQFKCYWNMFSSFRRWSWPDLIFALPQHLQRKPPKSRRVIAAQGSQGNTTRTSKKKKCLPPEKKRR